MRMAPRATSEFEIQLALTILESKPRAVLLDLDNTIFWEDDYWSSVLGGLPDRLSPTIPRSVGETLSGEIMAGFRIGNRRDIFQQALTATHMPEKILDIILKEFRTHVMPEGLRPRSWVLDWAPKFDGLIGIVSNGDAKIQRNKLANLRDLDYISSTDAIFTDFFPPKPNPQGSLALLKKWDLHPADCVFIGDSPQDQVCAATLGMRFVRSVPLDAEQDQV